MGRSANGQNVLAGGATIAQISAVSESESVSSTSTPRYRTVFSILLRPSKIKECSVSEANFSIQEEADRPDLPDFQGAFGTDLPASVPSRPAYRGRVILRDTHCISPRPKWPGEKRLCDANNDGCRRHSGHRTPMPATRKQSLVRARYVPLMVVRPFATTMPTGAGAAKAVPAPPRLARNMRTSGRHGDRPD